MREILDAFFLFSQDWLGRKFGFYALLIGSFSFIYDATYTLWSQHLDLLGMFLFLGFILSLNVQVITHNSKLSLLAQLGTSLLSLLIIFVLGGSAGQLLFLALAIITVFSFTWLPHKKQIQWQSLALSLVILALGFAIWIPDRLQIFCHGLPLLYGRSVFHYASTLYSFRQP